MIRGSLAKSLIKGDTFSCGGESVYETNKQVSACRDRHSRSSQRGVPSVKPVIAGLISLCSVGSFTAYGAPISPGETLDGHISVGEHDMYEFPAKKGHLVIALCGRTSGNFWPNVELLDPAGGTQSESGTRSARIVAKVAQGGTHRVRVSDYFNGTLTGDYRLTVVVIPTGLRSTADPDGGRIESAQLCRGSLTAADLDVFTFEGSSGQVVTALVGRDSGDCWPWLQLYDPSGTRIADVSGTRSAMLEGVRLSQSGLHAIVISDDFNGTLQGNYGLSLILHPGSATHASDPDGGPIAFEMPVCGQLQYAGDLDVFVFAGEGNTASGDIVTISVARDTGSFWPEVRLYDPQGSQIATESGTTSAVIRDKRLSKTGTYHIIVQDGFNGTVRGAYRVTLSRIPVRPSVVATVPPASASGVSPSQRVTLTFSKQMKKRTVERNTTFVRRDDGTPVPCTFDWLSAWQVRVVPSARLAYNTPYTVAVGRQAQSTEGWEMAEDFFLNFRTSPSMIVSSEPAKGSVDVCRWSMIRVQLRWPVIERSVETHFSLGEPGGPAIYGTFSWPTPQREFVFRPSRPLAANTVYTASLGPRVKRTTGEVLRWQESFSFATGDRPVVASFGPTGQSVHCESAILVVFDQPMDRISTRKAFSIAPSAEGHITWNSDGTRLRFAPSTPLLGGRWYKVTIGPSARSMGGAEMGCPFVWRFKTATDGASSLTLDVTAVPTQGGMVEIVLFSSTEAFTQVDILNVAGRVVASLGSRQVEEGLTRLLWDTRSATGTLVPPGCYLINARAHSANGAQTRSLVTVRVAR